MRASIVDRSLICLFPKISIKRGKVRVLVWLIYRKSGYNAGLNKNYQVFLQSLILKTTVMLDFSQFSGLVLFMFIFTAGFWLLLFLLTFVVPYWLGGSILEMLQEKREAKKAAKQK